LVDFQFASLVAKNAKSGTFFTKAGRFLAKKGAKNGVCSY
jgi:hypothetical protein